MWTEICGRKLWTVDGSESILASSENRNVVGKPKCLRLNGFFSTRHRVHEADNVDNRGSHIGKELICVCIGTKSLLYYCGFHLELFNIGPTHQ